MNQSTPWEVFTHHFRATCESFDHRWMKRRRIFDSLGLTLNILDLVGDGDSSYHSALFNFGSETKSYPAASSFCEARSKFPSHLLEELNYELFEVLTDLNEPLDWFGLTPYAVDGSKIHVPKKLEKQGFHVMKGCYYPTGLISGLIRISDRMIRSLNLSSSRNEQEFGHKILKELDEHDLLVYDRGYLSFALLSHHISRGVRGVFRASTTSSFREIDEAWQSSETDFITQIDPTDTTYRTARAACPDIQLGPIDVRIIKYSIGKKNYMLVTTVLDEEIPAQAFVDLYARRWRIEEFYKTFKETIGVEKFHSNSRNGVEQEIFAASIIWNCSRALNLLTQPFKKTPKKLKNIAISV